MSYHIKHICLTLLVIALLSSCKVSKIPSPDSIKERDTLLIETKVDTILYHITSKGDTLLSLNESVDLPMFKVKKDTLTFSAVGDIMMGTNYPSENYLPRDSGYHLWQHVKPFLQSTDVTFGNLEGVILSEGGDAKTCKDPKVCFLFRTPDYLAFHFKENGFDLLSTANNHANDFGIPGRANTQRVLDSLGIHHAGSVEQPYTILRRKGYTIGFVAVAPNIGTFSIHQTAQVKNVVAHLDSITDVVVVSFHAGAEGAKNQQVTRQREFYFGEDRGNVYEFSHEMIDAGADILLGHGPHVVRALEIYKNRLIAYSLGNFLTYGRFNLTGENALAPILEFRVTTTGEFVDGQIHSFIQTYDDGPIPDNKMRAAKKIKELSENDFPESQLYIEDSGKIIYLHR